MSILVEPFIKIRKQYEKYKTTAMMCENKHEHYHGEKFCKECGKEVKEIEVKKEQLIWTDELIGSENFWHQTGGKFMYLFSNIHDIGFSNPYENEMQVLSEKEMNSCIEIFKEKHKTDIELLENRLNIKVKVEFGVMYHAS